MMQLCGLVLFTLFLPCAGRRSIRNSDKFHDAQQQTNDHSQAFEESADARGAFLPRGLWRASFWRSGPRAGTLHAVHGQVSQLHAPHSRPLSMQYGRAGSLRGPRCATVALSAATDHKETGLKPKDGGQPPPVIEDLEEGDVVEYRLPASELGEDGCTLGLGVYTTSDMSSAGPHIRPLCRWTDELGTREMVRDEDARTVSLDAVQRVLNRDFIFEFQKQMGGGLGLGNPCGTEGQDCWDLSDLELSEGVRLVTREELEVWF